MRTHPRTIHTCYVYQRLQIKWKRKKINISSKDNRSTTIGHSFSSTIRIPDFFSTLPIFFSSIRIIRVRIQVHTCTRAISETSSRIRLFRVTTSRYLCSIVNHRMWVIARARARSYHGKRAILDLERIAGEKLAYMDAYRWIFRFLRRWFDYDVARRGKKIWWWFTRLERSKDKTRSLYPLLSFALAFLSSNGIYVLVAFRLRSSRSTIDVSGHHRVSIGHRRTPPPSAKVIGSRLPSAVQPAYRLLAPRSSRFFLDSFTHALATHRRHSRRIGKLRLSQLCFEKKKEDRRIRLDE